MAALFKGGGKEGEASSLPSHAGSVRTAIVSPTEARAREQGVPPPRRSPLFHSRGQRRDGAPTGQLVRMRRRTAVDRGRTARRSRQGTGPACLLPLHRRRGGPCAGVWHPPGGPTARRGARRRRTVRRLCRPAHPPPKNPASPADRGVRDSPSLETNGRWIFVIVSCRTHAAASPSLTARVQTAWYLCMFLRTASVRRLRHAVAARVSPIHRAAVARPPPVARPPGLATPLPAPARPAAPLPAPARHRAMATTSASQYLSSTDAAALDAELMGPSVGFSLEQLMELAGLAAASAVPAAGLPPSPATRVLVLAGPGNNGGDGLVVARHLKQWGFSVDVCYPKRPASQPHYARLVAQLQAVGVPFLDEGQVLTDGDRLKPGAWALVVDALLGFGARGPPRPPLDRLIAALAPAAGPPPILAVDIPSGWDVDAGDTGGNGARPAILVSLTAPKPCAARFEGAHHFVGGRFLPPALAAKYGLSLPPYPADGSQIVRVGGSGGRLGSTQPAPPPPPPPSAAAMRADYGNPAEAAVPGADLPDPAKSSDPLSVFSSWFSAASAAGVAEEPNAMCLSTVDPTTGAPSSRYVLMKGFDERGIQFYTNLLSRKGRELSAGPSPRASLVFYWEPMRRSVRVEGTVAPVPSEEADAYFASRPRGSQVGAHASRQSQPLLGGREELEAAVAAAEASFGADGASPVPRPAGWGGFIVQPHRWEFWTGRSSRLHDRVVFEKGEDGGWRVSRLAP